MVEHIQEVAGKLIDGLAPEIGVVRLYAYGSRVRGDADPGSDLDFLVELREVTPTAKRQILERAIRFFSYRIDARPYERKPRSLRYPVAHRTHTASFLWFVAQAGELVGTAQGGQAR